MATSRGGRHTRAARRGAGWWSVSVLGLAALGLVAASPAAATGRGHVVSLSAPTRVVAGVPFDVTVRLRPTGRDTGPYVGTVSFSTDDRQVRALPPDYTFTRADGGVHTFTGVTLVGTGHHRLTVRDTRSHRLQDADRITVANAGAAIEGQVLADFDPVLGATVTVYDAVTGRALKSGPANVDDNHYRITGLPAGKVKVGAVAPGPYAPDFANDRDTLEQANVFTLLPGRTLTQSWDEPFGPYLDLERLYPQSSVRIGDDGVVVPTAVNDRGQVVGYHYGDVANEDRTPFIWQEGVTTDLEGDWQPCALNNAGEIVGDPAYHWQDGTLTVLATNSSVHRITENGWTGGTRYDADGDRIGPETAYVWRAGVRTDLVVSPVISRLASIGGRGCGIESHSTLRFQDVNDQGTFLGLGVTREGVEAGFVVERGRARVLRDATGAMWGLDLNDAGQVAGAVQRHGTAPRAAIWTNGRITQVHVPGLRADESSWATAINERGEAVVVTGSHLSEWPLGRTYLWQRGKLTLVGPKGLQTFANQVNDAGQVAGVALLDPAEGTRQAFVWQPGDLLMLGQGGEGVAKVVDLSERGHVLALAYRSVAGADTPYALTWRMPPKPR